MRLRAGVPVVGISSPRLLWLSGYHDIKGSVLPEARYVIKIDFFFLPAAFDE